MIHFLFPSFVSKGRDRRVPISRVIQLRAPLKTVLFRDGGVSHVLKSSCIRPYTPVFRARLPCPHKKCRVFRGALNSLCVLVCVFVSFPSLAVAEPPSGIQPLHQLPLSHMYSLVQGDSIRALFTAQEQEDFLHELEKHPPEWDQLHDPPGKEHGARLFILNRRRDDLREGHSLLTQRIAFVWSGILGEYHDTHKGIKVVMGPHPTQTTWGIVRFKPVGLPNEMVAIPPPALLTSLKERITKGESLEIGILFTGTLIPWESIIYGFSHDGLEQGMVMPVVHVDGVRYFFNTKTE